MVKFKWQINILHDKNKAQSLFFILNSLKSLILAEA